MGSQCTSCEQDNFANYKEKAMKFQNNDKFRRTPGIPVTLLKRTWQIFTLLFLLILVVSQAAAAPLNDEPLPAGGEQTGEQNDDGGFIEFGPSNSDGLEPLTVPFGAPTLFSAPASVGVLAAPAGYLPSYDEEALAKFDVQRVLESDRYLAVDIGPRVTGTPQEQAAAEYFGAKLESYGYEVSYQHWNTRNDGTNRTQNVATVTSPNVDLQGGPDQTLGGPNWQMSASTNAKITGDEEAVEANVVYAGSGQSVSDFPADTAGKIVLMDYSTSSSTRNTAVVNAASLGAAGVILADTRSNRAPPSISLLTPQPDIPVVGGGTAHGDWIKALIANGPLTLRIATFSYTNLGTNFVAVRHAIDDPDGTTAPIIMVGGHIDGVLGAPAAHDNGTGPSTAVEIGRVLSQYALDKEIRIVGYGGEEIGMYGSKAYVASLSAEERARFVGAWDLDMEGTPYEPAHYWMLTPDGQSNFVVQSGYNAAARLGFSDIQNCRLGQSDHQSFYDADIPASLFIWLYYRPNVNGCNFNGSYTTEPQYHRPTDTMSNVSPERLEISLKVVGGAAFHSALNNVTLSAAAGTPVSGAAVEANCGDGWRYLGETDSSGSAKAVIPHATCDFMAMKGSTISTLDDIAITNDVSLMFPAFHLPEPVLLNGGADLIHGMIGEDWASCGELDTSSVGAKNVSCSDNAGNSSEVNYNVIYSFSGFFQPVDSLPALNTANSGQAIPLKWRITDVNGNPVTNLANVVVTAANLSCSLGITVDQVEEYTTGTSGLLNQGDGYYQFNWKTPKTYANSCKTMMFDLGEGSGMERTALFQFTK
jgi:Zn-dependent M28 family amino/carboxypeptidase